MLLPIVEILADAETHSERAKWMLTVPDDVIQRDYLSIRSVLRQSGFLLGSEYLEARRVSMYCTRTETGDLPADTRADLEALRSHVLSVSRQEAPARRRRSTTDGMG